MFVSLSGVAPAGGVSVGYATSDGTATAGSDYVAATGTLVIAAGNSFGIIAITVNGDTAVEDFEMLNVTLSSPTGAAIADGTAEGFIINDDFWPACGIVTAQCYSNFQVDLDGLGNPTLGFAAPPPGLSLEAFGFGGFVQIQLRYTPAGGDADYELVNASGSPITTNSVIRFTLNTGSIDPAGFFASGVVESFSAVSSSFTVEVRPQSSSWLFLGCDALGCGDPTTEADFTFGGVVFAGAFDFGSAAVNDDFRGSYFSTNAQQFGFGSAASGSVEFTLAAPHFKKRANPGDSLVLNTGFVRMFFRDAVLTDVFGIADPSSVSTGTFVVEKTSGGVTTSINFGVTRIAAPVAGVLIEAGTGAPGLTPFEFSTPTFKVKKAPAAPAEPAAPSAAPPAAPPAAPAVPAKPTGPLTPKAGVPLVTGDGDDEIVGGDGDFVVEAGNGNNYIVLGNGNMRVVTGSGDDRIFLGSGASRVESGDGRDRIVVGGGSSVIFAGPGADVVRTAGGTDHVAGGAGDDVLLLGAGDDRAYGGEGADYVAGGAGADRLAGGPGRDRLVGGSGDDVLDLRDGAGGDRVTCGAGRDVVFADRGDRIARDCEVVRWSR